MAIQIQGNGGTVAEVDGTTFRALRVTVRPADYGALGSYGLSMVSGTIAAALGSGSEVTQFRWTDATRLAIVRKIRVSGGVNVVASAAALLSLEAVIARSFSAAGTGGNTATLTGNNGKLRTSMGTTLLGEFRHISTAALGTGTKTLDAQGIGMIAYGVGTGALTVAISTTIIPPSDLLDDDGAGACPIVLAANEGWVIRTGIIGPAAMTWNLGVATRWSEVSAW